LHGEDTTIVTSPRRVVIGIDTHLDTIHLAALTDTGQPLGDAEFRTTPANYWTAICWARSYGEIVSVGVEGTSSYGAGITRALQHNGIHVVEVNRPDRSARRRQGKSDPLDAYSAARAVLGGHGLAVTKDLNTGALKALLIARRGAVKARTAAIQQIKDLLVTAPADLRERYRRYSTTLRLIEALSRCRPGAHDDPTTMSVLIACKALAQRVEFLERQDRELTAELDTLTNALNPALRAAYGVGPDQQPPTPVGGRVRDAGRRRADPSFIRKDHSAPAFPRRRPRRQQRPAPHRPGSLVSRHTHTRLRHPPTRCRPIQERHTAPAQTSHRPRDVQTPHRTLPD
jgi:hypothetical protein